MPNIYPYGEGFQLDVLYLMSRVEEFTLANRALLSKDYFDKRPCAVFADLVLRFADRYHTIPSLDNLNDEVNKLPGDDKEQVRQLMALLAAHKLGNVGYIMDEVRQFGRHQVMGEALRKAQELWKSKKYDDVVTEVLKSKMEAEIENLGESVFADAQRRIVERSEGKEQDEKVPTGFAELDEALHGGLGIGELGLVLGVNKVGKSLFCINLAHGAMFSGQPVMHFSLENRAKKVLARYDALLSSIPKHDLREHGPEILEALKHYSGYGADVWVKHYPMRSVGVNDFRAHLLRLKQIRNFNPKLIIVDYGDIMKPTRRREEKRLEIGEVFEELRGLAEESKAAVWSPTQASKKAASKDVVGWTDAGESIEHIKAADVVLSLSQTPDEYNASPSRMRVKIVRAREEAEGKTFACVLHYDYQRISDLRRSV